MASLIYLDTHATAWLFAGRMDLFPEQARALIEEHDLLISPAVVLELQYLYEIGRTAEPSRVVIQALAVEVGLNICDLPFPQVVEVALDQAWTRDPFDRFVVAQAMLRKAPLLTKDRLMREHYPQAVWKGAIESDE
ncbi:MAG TPA: PIN domain-containing protein [Thermoanaerobaculia bacterium]|nr:PIN domain-containing protein [Thermoanaerobaculia bacterium]